MNNTTSTPTPEETPAETPTPAAAPANEQATPTPTTTQEATPAENKVTVLSQFYTKNKTTIILAAIFLVSLFTYLLVHSFAHTEDPAQSTERIVKINKTDQAYLNLLSAKFSKFQVAVLHWNDVSGDTWRWDSWDRSRQAKALIEYLRAYDALYVTHTELDAGVEARILWVYALTMERIAASNKCSYANALDIIATKPIDEVVSMLNTKALSSAYVAELKKL